MTGAGSVVRTARGIAAKVIPVQQAQRNTLSPWRQSRIRSKLAMPASMMQKRARKHDRASTISLAIQKPPIGLGQQVEIKTIF